MQLTLPRSGLVQLDIIDTGKVTLRISMINDEKYITNWICGNSKMTNIQFVIN
jgi:hypothetical protein